MKRQNDKKAYVAPSLTVVAFKMETGYASSILSRWMLAIGIDNASIYGDDNVEDRIDGGYWGNNENGWF